MGSPLSAERCGVRSLFDRIGRPLLTSSVKIACKSEELVLWTSRRFKGGQSNISVRLLNVPALSENGGQQDPADISGRVSEGPRNLTLWMAPTSPLSDLVFIADLGVNPEAWLHGLP